MTLIAILTEVWTPANFIAAVVGGIALGWVTAQAANNPFFASKIAPPKVYAMLVMGYKLFSGLVFYSGQIVEAINTDDPWADRVVSRFALWVVFSIVTGTSAFFVLRHSRSRTTEERRSHWRRSLTEHEHEEH